MTMTTTRTLRRLPCGRMALALCGLAVSIAAPGRSLEALVFAGWNLLQVGPVVLVGIALTAGVTASGSAGLIASAFTGRQYRMIVLASLVGALIPVCGISILPLVAGLLAAGVPLASLMAFWLSSPVTDPGMLAVTAATLGLPFAVLKTVAAFGAGVFGGIAILLCTRLGLFQVPARPRPGGEIGASGACASEAVTTLKWRFWQDRARLAAFRETALSSARLMVVWLSVAFVAEFFLQLYVPETLVASVVGRGNAWAVPVSAIVGAPIYLDGYAALPLVRGLLDAGMRPDAAMAFLVAGGITSAWAAIPVFALVRLPVFLAYLVLAVLGAMLAGWVAGPFLA